MKIKKVFLFILNDLVKPVVMLPITILKAFFSTFNRVYGKFSGKLRFSITFKITTAYVLIVTLVLLILSIGVLASSVAYLLNREGNDLQKDFQLVSTYLEDSAEIPGNRISRLAEISKKSITLFDEEKNLLYTTEKNPEMAVFLDKYTGGIDILEFDNRTLLGADPTKLDEHIPRELFNDYGFALALNDSITTDSGKVYVQIIDKLPDTTVYFGILIFALIGLDVFFILLITLIGTSASKKILRPIQTMTETVKSITINQMDARLDISGSKNELKDLARTFNHMMERIQRSVDQQNQFVSDASHELRTPISVIQGYANMLDRWGKDDKAVLEEAIAAIKTESESMKDLIEKLLFLARGDKDLQRIEKEDFLLNELIDEIIKETRLIDTDHEIVSERIENIALYADRSLLKEALRIFVDNSVKYTPEGGRIKLECFPQEQTAVITIEDTGIGISKEDLPHVFSRFYRADKSRTKQTGGTGLGLTIAKWIILKHNGTIKIQSEINVGTRISIAIPIQ